MPKDRPKSLENNTERISIMISKEMKEAIYAYYVERLGEDRSFHVGVTNAVRELLTKGLDVWYKEKENK